MCVGCWLHKVSPLTCHPPIQSSRAWNSPSVRKLHTSIQHHSFAYEKGFRILVKMCKVPLVCGRTGRTRNMVGEMLPPRSVGAWNTMIESGEGNLGCRVSEERARFADSFFAISGDNGTTPLEVSLGCLKTREYASILFSEKTP